MQIIPKTLFYTFWSDQESIFNEFRIKLLMGYFGLEFRKIILEKKHYITSVIEEHSVQESSRSFIAQTQVR